MRTVWWTGLTLLLGSLALFACSKPEPAAQPKAKASPALSQASCGKQEAFEQLKAAAFAKAKSVRVGDTETLDRLGATAVVRMDRPAASGRDEALNVTLCKGRMAIDLPPGFQDAFNGDRQIVADVDYGVQAAADRRLRAYPIDGLEPVVYRLAAIDLKTAPQPVPRPPTAIASASPSAAAGPTASARHSAGPEPRLTARGRPSFDCRDIRSRADRMVCGDERLAALDRVAASLYDRAMDDGDRETREILSGTQGGFIARRGRCGTPACVAAVYRDRMDEIDRIAAGG